jgi:hypothetical protein
VQILVIKFQLMSAARGYAIPMYGDEGMQFIYKLQQKIGAQKLSDKSFSHLILISLMPHDRGSRLADSSCNLLQYIT